MAAAIPVPMPRRATATAAAAACLAALVALMASARQAHGAGPAKTFGASLSQGTVTATEQTLLSYNLSSTGEWGVITHWWVTGGPTADFITLAFFVDGETTPSIAVTPGMACGVGFNDMTRVPWSTRWFGKNALEGGWFNNIRIPFTRSIRVTYTAGPGQPDDSIYLIVRGSENMPTLIGGLPLPPTARLRLAITNATFPALAYVPLISAPNATGLYFMHTLSFTSGNLNTLEGCYHAYTPADAPFPGLLLSSGTEDYFDSAYYFNGGLFTGENSGFTHYNSQPSGVTLSAYRVHDQDPVAFSDGFQLVWRNGDATDPATGLKCTIETGGHPVGSPTTAQVFAYAWYYTW